MTGNQFGHYFSITTFGESHGAALGVVVDGCPAGVTWRPDLMASRLNRRRPGQSALVSARQESDQFELLSGVYEERTLGTPIALLVRNQDARSEDYSALKDQARPGHADDVWQKKYGHRDHRGGGRSSGRETVARVMAGAVAEMLLSQMVPQIRVVGFSAQIGPIALSEEQCQIWGLKALEQPALVDAHPTRLPDDQLAQRAGQLLEAAKTEGRSYGGAVQLWIKGVPPGIGRPVFHKLKADLAAAMMSVGAVSAVGFGMAAGAANAEGSEFHSGGENPYGGIRGGLATGEPIQMKITFKPTASVLDVAKKGRHDPCIVPRAIPVLEAMAWLVLADQVLAARLDRI